MKWKIGNIEINNRLVLAPMAGISNTSYRKIVKEMGVGLIYAEMVSVNALNFGNDKTFSLLKMSEEERPIVQQIFGSDIDSFVSAAKIIEEKMHPDIIDINMGCPAPKVVKNGDGSKLLLNLDLVYEIVKRVVEVSKVPVTVKIRKGWDEENIVAVEAAKAIEKAGASAITVHGRTRSQFYTGTADWDIIKKVKEAVNIPVIGNGDIVNGETAKKVFETTGVDGIMIGRACLGNPWVFNEVISYLNGDTYVVPTKQEVLDTIIKHYDMLTNEKGEYTAVREMRKHIAWYIKGMKDASVMRNHINTLEKKQDTIETLKSFFEK